MFSQKLDNQTSTSAEQLAKLSQTDPSIIIEVTNKTTYFQIWQKYVKPTGVSWASFEHYISQHEPQLKVGQSLNVSQLIFRAQRNLNPQGSPPAQPVAPRQPAQPDPSRPLFPQLQIKSGLTYFKIWNDYLQPVVPSWPAFADHVKQQEPSLQAGDTLDIENLYRRFIGTPAINRDAEETLPPEAPTSAPKPNGFEGNPPNRAPDEVLDDSSSGTDQFAFLDDFREKLDLTPGEAPKEQKNSPQEDETEFIQLFMPLGPVDALPPPETVLLHDDSHDVLEQELHFEPVAPSPNNAYRQRIGNAFAQKFSTYAQDAMKRSARLRQEAGKTGMIPASIILAQAMLESGFNLEPQGNNFFGIKCHGSWDGESFYKKDDDYDAEGNLVSSCFRAYESPLESFNNHTDFLMNNTRYEFLFSTNPRHFRKWARGLQRAGYATDKHYPNKLIDLYQSFDLGAIDDQVLTELDY